MNLGLLIFNLLPIYPLDGGQILRSLLWFVLERARSLKVVAVLGLIGGWTDCHRVLAPFFLAGSHLSLHRDELLERHTARANTVAVGVVAAYTPWQAKGGIQRDYRSQGSVTRSHSPRIENSPGPGSRIVKNPHSQTAEDAWLTHKQKTAEWGARGLTLRSLSSFADSVEIEKMKLGMVIEA
jgi:hypothetical protein